MTLSYRDKDLFLKSIEGLRSALLAKKTLPKLKLPIFVIFVGKEHAINVCINIGILACKKAKFVKLVIISS